MALFAINFYYGMLLPFIYVFHYANKFAFGNVECK